MAQPNYAIEYLGAMFVPGKTPVTTASLLIIYPTATVIKMKCRDVKVSVDNSDMFEVSFDDESYLATGHTYTFSKDCMVAIGIYKAIT